MVKNDSEWSQIRDDEVRKLRTDIEELETLVDSLRRENTKLWGWCQDWAQKARVCEVGGVVTKLRVGSIRPSPDLLGYGHDLSAEARRDIEEIRKAWLA